MASKAMAIARRRRETRASPSLQAKVRRSAALRSWRIGRDTIGVARDKMSPELQNHNLGPTATFSTSRVTFFRLWYYISSTQPPTGETDQVRRIRHHRGKPAQPLDPPADGVVWPCRHADR